jgi:hypothetical protein
MNKILHVLKHELIELLPPTIFFFVILHVVLFIRALMDQQYGIEISASMGATIAALIVGKAVLITDSLPFVNWFKQSRLIYNILWRIFLYLVLIFILQFLEELVPVLHNYETIWDAIVHTAEDIKWYRFWATYILLSVFLTIYTIATELVSDIGRKDSLKLFFNKNR